ncbi:MAG TPA: hypothetical protein VD902_17195 [Symbiobacteriaceae bacterium]|nr:hypothetical protein [Symbiobacteriaceae bacterium]
MQVKVVERQIENASLAREARAYISSVLRLVVLRKLSAFVPRE